MILALWACSTPDPALALTGDAAAGQESWEADCTLCHGLVGEGSSRGPVITGYFEDHTDADLLEVVRLGRGDMPGSDLDDQGLADLLAFLHGLL